MPTRYFSVTSVSSVAGVAPDIATDLARNVAHRTVQETVTAADATTTVDEAILAKARSLKSNETVRIAVDATGGTFTVTFGGQTTTALAFNVSAADFEVALAALSTVGAADIDVSGGPGVAGGGTPYYLQFVNQLGGADVGAVTTGAGSLTGGAGTAAVTVIVTGGATPTA